MLIAYRVPHGLLKKIRVTKEVYTDIYMQMTRHLTPFLLLLVEPQTNIPFIVRLPHSYVAAHRQHY